jgi:flagellar hook protein FlgE
MSFDIALSGIQAINEQLETTSNNIANASTYGFKSSRANFSSVYAGAQANGVEVGSLTQTIGQNGSPSPPAAASTPPSTAAASSSAATCRAA